METLTDERRYGNGNLAGRQKHIVTNRSGWNGFLEIGKVSFTEECMNTSKEQNHSNDIFD